MKVVNKDQVLTKKRQKKPKLETPREYRLPYSHMSEGLEGQRYYVRAKDPGAVYTNRMKEVLTAERREEKQLRPVIFSNRGNGRSVVFGATFMNDAEIMGIPAGSSAQDIDFLQKKDREIKNNATLDTLTNRLQMLLGMLGDVTVETVQESLWRPGSHRILTVKGHRFKLQLLD